MSGCWLEDFERYPNPGVASMLEGAWASIDSADGGGTHGYTLATDNPRTGTQCLKFIGDVLGTSQFARRILGGPKSGAGIEYGLQITNLPSTDNGPNYTNACWLGQFLDAAGGLQCGATIGSDGAVLIIDVATGLAVARSRPIIQAGVYLQIGVKVGVVDSVNGVMEVRVNNVVAVSAVTNTNPTGAGEVSQIRFEWSSQAFGGVSFAWFDDMHTWDTTPGNGPSDFVGNAAIIRRPLTADTTRADMTVVGGATGHAVLSDGNDATYIEAENIGLRSEFTGGALPSEVTGVIAQQVTYRAAKTNVGDCNVLPYIATPGASPETVDLGVEQTLSAGEQWYWSYFATEPSTGMPFTPAEIAADRVGFERTL
jgi:hypothetical protein